MSRPDVAAKARRDVARRVVRRSLSATTRRRVGRANGRFLLVFAGAASSDDTPERALGESPATCPSDVSRSSPRVASASSSGSRSTAAAREATAIDPRRATRTPSVSSRLPLPMDARRASRNRPRAPPRRPRSSASRTTRWTRARRRRPTLGRRNPPWPTQRRLPRPKLSTPPRLRNQSRFPSRASRIRSRPSSSVSSTAPFARS